MRRKLISQGGGGFTIYLPKKWIDKNNLGKGNELGIEIAGPNLIISPKDQKKILETEIKLTGLTESLIRTLITNTYRKGYDRIKVTFENEKQFQTLRQVIKTKLIGFDIIKKEKYHCIVENITEPSPEQFENLIKKIFLNIKELFKITKDSLGIEKTSDLEDLTEVEERIMKYDNFCRRVISKQRLTQENPEFLWTFLTLLTHSTREIYYLNKIIGKNTKISKETSNLLTKTEELFELIEKAYSKKDKEALTEIHDMEKELIYKKASSLLQTKKGKESLVIYYLASCIRKIYQANSPLLGLII